MVVMAVVVDLDLVVEAVVVLLGVDMVAIHDDMAQIAEALDIVDEVTIDEAVIDLAAQIADDDLVIHLATLMHQKETTVT